MRKSWRVTAVVAPVLAAAAVTCGGRIASTAPATTAIDAGPQDDAAVARPAVDAPDEPEADVLLAEEGDGSEAETATPDALADTGCPQCPPHASCFPMDTPPCLCDPGYYACGDQCFDFNSDPEHCGSCTACPAGDACQGGLCVSGG